MALYSDFYIAALASHLAICTAQKFLNFLLLKKNIFLLLFLYSLYELYRIECEKKVCLFLSENKLKRHSLSLNNGTVHSSRDKKTHLRDSR
jgi:hypothetical protein